MASANSGMSIVDSVQSIGDVQKRKADSFEKMDINEAKKFKSDESPTDGPLDLHKQCVEPSNEMDIQMEKKSTNAAANEGQSSSSSTWSAASNAEPDEDPMLISQLNEQRKLAKHIYIENVKCNSSASASIMLSEIWQKLGVKVLDSDIANVDYRGKNITVEFKHVSIKNMILEQSAQKTVWSTDLTGVARGKKPWEIKIGHAMIPAYRKMMASAEAFQKTNAIHSFQLGDDGMFVKRSANDAGRNCLSKQQFRDYIDNAN